MKLSDVLKAIGAMGPNPSLSTSRDRSSKGHHNERASGWTAPEMSFDQIERIQERIIGAVAPANPGPDEEPLAEISPLTDEQIEAFFLETQASPSPALHEAPQVSEIKRDNTFRKRILVGSLALALVVTSLGPVALINASPGPRSSLYPVRIALENWRATVASSDLQESRVLLSITSSALADLDQISDPTFEELTALVGRINASESRALELLRGVGSGATRNESLGRLLGISRTHVSLVESMAAEATGPGKELLLHSRSVGQRILDEAQAILVGRSPGDTKYAQSAEVLTSEGLAPNYLGSGRMSRTKDPVSGSPQTQSGQASPEADHEVPSDEPKRCDVTNGVICITPPQIPSIPSI